MRIGIDARLWGEEKNRGLGRYVKQLILNLEKIASSKDKFFIFLRKNNFDQYQPAVPNFKKILWDVPWYTLKEQVYLPPHPHSLPDKERGTKNIDIMHFPHWNIPYFYNCPFIVTIHDLILLESNRERRATTLGKTRYAIKFAGFKLILNHVLKKTKKIIAISESTKNSIIKYCPWTEQKIEVVYEGITPLPATPSTEKIIIKPYLLYVGSAYPHKNLEFLIKAFNKFNQKQNNAYQLVLVGREDFFYQRLRQKILPLCHSEHQRGISYATIAQGRDEIPQLPRQGGVARDDTPMVVFFGQTTDTKLNTLYHNATAFVTASLQEGFALPALEAMAAGLPVLASDISCFREILGSAALYFNPKNTRDFVAKLNQLLFSQNLRGQLITNAQKQIQQFSWQKCAQETLAIYRSVV